MSSPFDRLPSELALAIFTRLSYRQLLKVERVCKKWQKWFYVRASSFVSSWLV